MSRLRWPCDQQRAEREPWIEVRETPGKAYNICFPWNQRRLWKGSYILTSEKRNAKAKAYCPYCDSDAHYLNQCPAIQKLTKAQVTEWIQSNNKCWRCGRSHQAAQCTLKKRCGLCQGKHLQVLHEVNSKTPEEEPTERSCLINTATEVLYLDQPTDCNRVLLKVIRVILCHGKRTLGTYAILDDGSERTMLLSAAAEKLGLKGKAEDLALRTIRLDV